MDAESGDDDKDGLTNERGGESRHEWRRKATVKQNRADERFIISRHLI